MSIAPAADSTAAGSVLTSTWRPSSSTGSRVSSPPSWTSQKSPVPAAPASSVSPDVLVRRGASASPTLPPALTSSSAAPIDVELPAAGGHHAAGAVAVRVGDQRDLDLRADVGGDGRLHQQVPVPRKPASAPSVIGPLRVSWGGPSPRSLVAAVLSIRS